MVLLGFTMFCDKILSGQKRQTIRKLRKRPIMPGDHLHLYWKPRTKQCEKLGEAISRGRLFFITIQRLGDSIRIDRYLRPVKSDYSSFVTLTDRQMRDLAKRDGFKNVFLLVETLSMLHSNAILDGNTFFQIIRWKLCVGSKRKSKPTLKASDSMKT